MRYLWAGSKTVRFWLSWGASPRTKDYSWTLSCPIPSAFDPEIKVHESNRKLHHMTSLHRDKMWSVLMCLVLEVEVTRRVLISDAASKLLVRGLSFPRQGIRMERARALAQATRAFSAHEHPSRVVERMQSLVDKNGWSLICTPLNFPSS